jgi:uncharacterized membrane protein
MEEPMMASWLFAFGLISTATLSGVVVLYLRQPLATLLGELCGSQYRAEFWTAFSAIAIGLVPLIFALTCEPVADAGTKWGLIGLVISVMALGWVVSRFIPRD